jgi:hypothetical protein
MLFLKSSRPNVSISVISFTLIFLLGACSFTTLADHLEPDILQTATAQAILPTATPEAVPSPMPTETSPPARAVEEVIAEDEDTTPEAIPTDDFGSTRTIQPEQLTGYIPNPDMGWQDTQRRNKRFFETVGYRRLNWYELNPVKGVYDWDRIEALRENMAQQGGAISFRIRTAQPPPWGNGHTMPDWLVNRGAVITDSTSDILEGVASTEPLYYSCLFLEAHGQFIEALRQRYDGDPQVAYIDIGSYGNYGEWDSAQYNERRESLDWHARRRIIDMYLGGQGSRPCQETNGQIIQVEYAYPGFQQTQLVMPYTPWFADSLEYALERRPDVGIRHDALGSESHQQRYREEIGHLVMERWPHAPIIFEYYPEAYTPEALRSARNFATEMHASFVHENFDGQGDNDLIEALLETIGYRLVLKEITYSSELGPGDTFAIDMTWENTGLAPPYFEPYPLVISLTDAQGRSSNEWQLEPDTRDWLPGKPIFLIERLQLPTNLRPGIYDLRIAFVDPATNQPALALAIAGQDTQGRYLIGPVTVGR